MTVFAIWERGRANSRMTPARDYFSDLARDIDAMNAAWCGGDGIGAVVYDGMPHASSSGDALERLAISRIESGRDMVARCHRIGEGRRLIGRVRANLGDAFADVLQSLYIERMTVGRTACGLRISKSTVCSRRDIAMDWIDAVGLERVLAGMTLNAD